jgi:NADPH2:quinone reductase
MRAVLCRTFGELESLVIEDVNPPPLAAGCVRISVRAAGISFAHVLVIQGKHQNRPSLPFVPGTEIAGVVTDIASDVDSDIRIGDRVCAGLSSGGYAEQAVVPSGTVFRIPDWLDFPTAVHFPTIYATAYAALVWLAKLQPAEVLLVHGAAGASGLAAVELGRAFGATVIATASSAEKLAVVKAHGATHVINYGHDDFPKTVNVLTNGRGVDVVFDPVGGDVFDASLHCAAPLARIIPIGFASGRIPQIPANVVLVKNLTVIGLYWSYYMGWGKTHADAATRARVSEIFHQLFRLFEQGAIRPVTDCRLPLEDFVTGLRRVQNRAVIGKVVLVPSETQQ